MSGSWEDEGGTPSDRAPHQLNKQWMLAAAGGFVVVAIVAVAGVASVWDSTPKLAAQSTEPPPPREYGGPLWFTVGGPTETQLVTNTNPRNSPDGPGTAYTGVARYLSSEKCFTDGTNLLVWPRGSRPLSGDRPGVSPAQNVEIFDGDTFSANSESIVIGETEDFPETPPACAPSGHALSLSVVHKN